MLKQKLHGMKAKRMTNNAKQLKKTQLENKYKKDDVEN